MIRTAGTLPPDFEMRLRRAVASVHPALPVPPLVSQLDQIARTSGRERVFAQLLTIFGGFALVLASIGVHGLTSYSVSRRTNEIGVRVALGARPAQVIWLVMRQVAGIAVVGVMLGVPAALAAGPLLSSILFEVAPADPGVLVGAALMMARSVPPPRYSPPCVRRASRR